MKFQKGVSPNPGGRPKVPEDVKQLWREHTPEAVQKVVSIMRNKRVAPSIQLSAAQTIIERAYGRPSQEVALSGGLTLDTPEMTDLELAQRLWSVLERGAAQVQ